MIPVIMKIGTQSSYAYWIWGNKPLRDYTVGDHIKFKPQLLHGTKWEHGIIREIKIDMPVVELF